MWLGQERGKRRTSAPTTGHLSVRAPGSRPGLPPRLWWDSPQESPLPRPSGRTPRNRRRNDSNPVRRLERLFWVANRHQRQPLGRSRPTTCGAVLCREHGVDLRRGNTSETHVDQHNNQSSHHLMTECIGGNGELDEVPAVTPGSPLDLPRRHGTGRAPAKRCEIVCTDKEGRRLIHRIDIEPFSHVPGGAGLLRIVDRSIEHPISIGAAGCGEPGVESVVDTPGSPS